MGKIVKDKKKILDRIVKCAISLDKEKEEEFKCPACGKTRGLFLVSGIRGLVYVCENKGCKEYNTIKEEKDERD